MDTGFRNRNRTACSKCFDAFSEKNVGEALSHMAPDGGGHKGLQFCAAQGSTDGTDDVDRTIIALPRIGLEEVSHNLFEGLWHHRIEPERPERQGIQKLACTGFFAASIATKNLVQHETHGVQVRPRTQLCIPACPLFGCHPNRGPPHALLVKSQFRHSPRETKIGHPSIRPSVGCGVQQYVGRLEVLVEEAACVHVCECIEYMVHQSNGFAHGWALFQ
jgi:hypothetical protein